MKTEEKIIRGTNPKSNLLALASLAFTIAGIFMIGEGIGLKAWFVTIFFGLCLLVFIIQFIPGATQLKLTEQGFTMTTMFRNHFIMWIDVESFQLGKLGSNETVIYALYPIFNINPMENDFYEEIPDRQVALPTTYGLKAMELLEIMNEWKKKYGTSKA